MFVNAHWFDVKGEASGSDFFTINKNPSAEQKRLPLPFSRPSPRSLLLSTHGKCSRGGVRGYGAVGGPDGLSGSAAGGRETRCNGVGSGLRSGQTEERFGSAH